MNTLLVSILYSGQRFVVRLAGEIDAASVGKLRGEHRYEVQGYERISLPELATRYQLEIDTAEVRYISADGLRAICELDLASRRADLGGVILRQPSRAVQRVIAIIAKVRPQTILPMVRGM